MIIIPDINITLYYVLLMVYGSCKSWEAGVRDWNNRAEKEGQSTKMMCNGVSFSKGTTMAIGNLHF